MDEIFPTPPCYPMLLIGIYYDSRMNGEFRNKLGSYPNSFFSIKDPWIRLHLLGWKSRQTMPIPALVLCWSLLLADTIALQYMAEGKYRFVLSSSPIYRARAVQDPLVYFLLHKYLLWARQELLITLTESFTYLQLGEKCKMIVWHICVSLSPSSIHATTSSYLFPSMVRDEWSAFGLKGRKAVWPIQRGKGGRDFLQRAHWVKGWCIWLKAS